MSEIDPHYVELCIAKGLMCDKDFVATVSNVFEKDYFDSPELQQIFEITTEHFVEYNELPSRDIIRNSIPEEHRDSLGVYYREMDSTDFDVARNYDWLKDQTNELLRDRAIKDAIRRSVDIIEGQDDTYEIRKLIEDALCKNLNIDLGLNYFDQLGSRLNRIFTDDTQRIPTYIPMLDEYLNGGLPPKTLSVLVAKIHGFKSNVMANIIARQVLNGHNVCLASLEMSEDMFAQRFDGIYSKLDVNRFYFNPTLQRQLIQRLGETKNTEGRGNLYIKAFPTGKASVADFRIWIRELKMRGHEPDIFFFDYLNLMSPEVKSKESLYADVKSIAEETRAMGFEFDIPMVSVSQLNRSGTFMNFDDVDFNSIAESMGVPATADFMMIMGSNDDHMVYNNEVHYKIVKNRLGGRVGEMDKFFYDGRSLKMYCSSEMQMWMDDVESSGDDRALKQHGED